MRNGISESIDEGHIILFITRKGAAISKDTTYNVFEVSRMKDSNLKQVTPNKQSRHSITGITRKVARDIS
jgi:hypothetical protein